MQWGCNIVEFAHESVITLKKNGRSMLSAVANIRRDTRSYSRTLFMVSRRPENHMKIYNCMKETRFLWMKLDKYGFYKGEFYYHQNATIQTNYTSILPTVVLHALTAYTNWKELKRTAQRLVLLQRRHHLFCKSYRTHEYSVWKNIQIFNVNAWVTTLFQRAKQC